MLKLQLHELCKKNKKKTGEFSLVIPVTMQRHSALHLVHPMRQVNQYRLGVIVKIQWLAIARLKEYENLKTSVSGELLLMEQMSCFI